LILLELLFFVAVGPFTLVLLISLLLASPRLRLLVTVTTYKIAIAMVIMAKQTTLSAKEIISKIRLLVDENAELGTLVKEG
jgi:hypothetical protein